MINVTWQLFPVNGSYYDPRVTSVITAAVAVVVAAAFASAWFGAYALTIWPYAI